VLPDSDWTDTIATLHLWTQVVGKIRLACGPWLNHSWGVTLYLTSHGLGTSLVPYGSEAFELDLDLLEDTLRLRTTSGKRRAVPLTSGRSVAEFHADALEAMAAVDMPVIIDPMPNEIADAVPFPDDTAPRTYRPVQAVTLWRALVQSQRVLTRFRADFLGKASPVHFFWGSFDLAVTRFSGRTAPDHPGGVPNFPDDVAREAYSHEVTSAGFWPGNSDSPTPIFYAYAYPTPDGYDRSAVAPDGAFWLDALGEFVLPYEAVRTADDPDRALTAFLQSTHAAAADLARWDRGALECADPRGPDWWHNRAPSRPPSRDQPYQP
jgi:hypothetical protein